MIPFFCPEIDRSILHPDPAQSHKSYLNSPQTSSNNSTRSMLPQNGSTPSSSNIHTPTHPSLFPTFHHHHLPLPAPHLPPPPAIMHPPHPLHLQQHHHPATLFAQFLLLQQQQHNQLFNQHQQRVKEEDQQQQAAQKRKIKEEAELDVKREALSVTPVGAKRRRAQFDVDSLLEKKEEVDDC